MVQGPVVQGFFSLRGIWRISVVSRLRPRALKSARLFDIFVLLDRFWDHPEKAGGKCQSSANVCNNKPCPAFGSSTPSSHG